MHSDGNLIIISDEESETLFNFIEFVKSRGLAFDVRTRTEIEICNIHKTNFVFLSDKEHLQYRERAGLSTDMFDKSHIYNLSKLYGFCDPQSYAKYITRSRFPVDDKVIYTSQHSIENEQLFSVPFIENANEFELFLYSENGTRPSVLGFFEKISVYPEMGSSEILISTPLNEQVCRVMDLLANFDFSGFYDVEFIKHTDGWFVTEINFRPGRPINACQHSKPTLWLRLHKRFLRPSSIWKVMKYCFKRRVVLSRRSYR